MITSSIKKENPFCSSPIVARHEIEKDFFSNSEELEFINWNIIDDSAIISPNLRKILEIQDNTQAVCWRDWINLFHPNEHDAVIREIEALQNTNTDHITTRHRKKSADGSYISFLAHMVVLARNENNMPTQLLITCIHKPPYEGDRTSFEIAQMEYTLTALNEQLTLSQNRENHLLSMIKQMQVPIAILDTKMRYLAISNAWINVYNLKNQGDIIGKSHYDVFPNQPENWIDAHKMALGGEVYLGGEECYCTPEGALIWITGSIYPWYSDAQTQGGIIISTEIITKRKNSEQRLSHMVNELMRSNQDLERFAHICSHDLKGPLRSISSFLQLLVKHNSDVFDDISLMYIPHIVQNINRMDELIKGILEYSKISHEPNKHTSIDMSIVLNELIEDLTLKTKQLNATINVSLLSVLDGDYIKIKQIFSNLIENSLKFHSHKPPIIDITCDDDDEFWKFTVRDNGVGIKPENSADIFNIFKRLHSDEEYEGTGVGLSIVKKNVNAHGGDIYIQANPTGGCEFIFTLQKQKKIINED